MINTLTLHEWNYTIPRGSILISLQSQRIDIG
jgi:hypothetical protein